MYVYLLSIFYSQSLYKSRYHLSAGERWESPHNLPLFFMNNSQGMEVNTNQKQSYLGACIFHSFEKCHILPEVSFSSKFYNFFTFIFSNVIFLKNNS